MKVPNVALARLGSSGASLRPTPSTRHRATGKQSIRRRYLIVLLTAVIGVAGSIGAFVVVRSWDRRVAELDFENTARDRLQIIANDFQVSTIVLNTLRALFESAEQPVTRQQFARFSRSLHTFAVGLRDAGWAPRVSHADRAAFEQAQRDAGLPGFEIREPGPGGKFVRAADRDAYFPILEVDGDPSSSSLLGVDLGFEGERRGALRRTLETGAPSGTPPLRLLTIPADHRGMMAFLVVEQRDGSSLPTPRGVVFGAFDAVDMINGIVATKASLRGLDIFVFGPDASPDASPLYARQRTAAESPPPLLSTLLAGPHWSGPLLIADQPWIAVFRPTTDLLADDLSWQTLMPMATGLTLTAMIVCYFLLSVRRTVQLETLTTNLRRTSEELSHNMAQVSYLARHDQLTGLPNRVVFQERLQAAISGLSKPRAFFLLYLDLDRFKPINDTLGHAAGDQMLCEVAARMRACLREDDALARLGGDEFGVIIRTSETLAGARVIAERLIELVSEPYSIEGNVVGIGMSVGIATFPQHGETAELLQIRADQALYAAKHAGRGLVFVFSETARSPTLS